MAMTFGEFHNGLRIMLAIDMHELEAAGIIRQGDRGAWAEFHRDPFRWFIRADDVSAGKLWAIIERRNRGHSSSSKPAGAV